MSRSDPATGFALVTKSDTVALNTPSRALYVGTGGDITVKGGSGQTVLFKSVPAGFILPVEVSYVMSTGTTAADIVALF